MLGVVIRNFVSDAWVSEVVFTIQNVIGIWNWKVLLPGPSIFMRQNNALLETSWSLYWLLHQLNYPPDLVSQISEVDMVPAAVIASIGLKHWAVLKTTSIWLALAVSWWFIRGTRSTLLCGGGTNLFLIDPLGHCPGWNNIIHYSFRQCLGHLDNWILFNLLYVV